MSDLHYWSRRAEREAVAAVAAGDARIAAIHQELARCYVEQVVLTLGTARHAGVTSRA